MTTDSAESTREFRPNPLERIFTARIALNWEVAFYVALNTVQWLTGMLRDQSIRDFTDAKNLAGVNIYNVGHAQKRTLFRLKLAVWPDCGSCPTEWS